MNDFFQSPYFTYLIVPLLICMSRIVDVTLGTLRIILVSKGAKKLAPVLGFFEVLIWLIAIGQVMQNLTNVVNYIAYATGFALGNYIGIIIEHKIAIGMVVVRVITRHDATDLVNFFKKSKYGITVLDANDGYENVDVIFTVIKRSDLPRIVKVIKKFNPAAFYSVEDVRFVSNAVLPSTTKWRKFRFNPLASLRKSK
jgi:uncharacterized protein YebE (UPF0316 family)